MYGIRFHASRALILLITLWSVYGCVVDQPPPGVPTADRGVGVIQTSPSVPAISDAAAMAGKVALVVGNSVYKNERHLKNPGNDATAMAEMLRYMDYDVILGTNLDRATFQQKIAEFARASRKAEVALLFYSGHGWQEHERNYLVPTDAKPTTDYAIDLDDTIRNRMQSPTKLVFLDACRNSLRTAGANPSSGTKGLALVMPPGGTRVPGGTPPSVVKRGTLIAFAAAPGQVAWDGTGRNSPFTAALLQHIGKSGPDVDKFMADVSDSVMKSTDRRQIPWRRYWGHPERYPFLPPPGKRLQDCPECPELVVVPAGNLVIDSPSWNPAGRGVRLDVREPVAVGRYKVTFDEWEACARGGGCGRYRPHDDDRGRGRRPVVNVSWNDAKAYVEWVSERTGKEYRLLGESEWEYVARAGRTRWGRGSPNDFGLHGVSVSEDVWEWMEDCADGNCGGAPVWCWNGDCARVARRSASRINGIDKNLRSPYRISGMPDRYHIGFRVARTLIPPHTLR